MEKFGFCLVFYCLAFLHLVMVNGGDTDTALRIDFYEESCPKAEAIVQEVVYKHTTSNIAVAAALIRLHFHDCFVRGCDASVLLDSTPGNVAEKDSPPNLSLRGFEVIDEAKALLEAQCPQTVSCADIIAFAARDSTLIVGNIPYSVPAGRRDGKISKAADFIPNIPAPFFNVQQLERNFASKGLSLDEMVTLSGAHSIGVTRCLAFSDRLYNFNGTNTTDPSMDPDFAERLKAKCPRPGNGTGTADLDSQTPNSLDNQYYRALRQGKGVLGSDQVLTSNSTTACMVTINARHGSLWAEKFAGAMVHLGEIQVLTGRLGEIRKNCSVVNGA